METKIPLRAQRETELERELLSVSGCSHTQERLQLMEFNRLTSAVRHVRIDSIEYAPRYKLAAFAPPGRWVRIPHKAVAVIYGVTCHVSHWKTGKAAYG